MRSLEAALASPSIPADLVTSLLNLAEFMEHDDKSLPLDIRCTTCYDHHQPLHVMIGHKPIAANLVASLLNLAEFMEHDDKSLPLDIRDATCYSSSSISAWTPSYQQTSSPDCSTWLNAWSLTGPASGHQACNCLSISQRKSKDDNTTFCE